MKNQITKKQIERIEQNRYKSHKWNELYLKTFHTNEIENGILTNDIPDFTIYHGKRIASIVLRKNAERSGGTFENQLYLSCIGYDIYNGTQGFYNVGGEDITGNAIECLQECIDKGYETLDSITDIKDKTVFQYVCYRLNQEIHKKRTDSKILTDLETAQITNYNDFIIEAEEIEVSDQILFIDIMEHIKLTPIQSRYLDYIANGSGIREIARAENKAHTTILEALRSVRKKFVTYCDENNIEFTRFSFIDKYMDKD